MGARIDRTETGTEVELHTFDRREAAIDYLTVSREYKFDHHESWAFTEGFDFYKGPIMGERAALRKKDRHWQVAFWIEGGVKVERETRNVAAGPTWRGMYRLDGEWLPVTNNADAPIAYASREAAAEGALLTLTEQVRKRLGAPAETRQ